MVVLLWFLEAHSWLPASEYPYLLYRDIDFRLRVEEVKREREFREPLRRRYFVFLRFYNLYCI